MPKVFTQWTVLPHEPVEKLADNLWRVSGKLGDVQRQMVLARRKDGGVVVYNGVALEDAAMKELEAWGKPSLLVVPNGYHRQDAAIWKQRYPEMKVVAPKGGRKRVAKIVPVDAVTEDAPADPDVSVFAMDGCAFESCLQVRSNGEVTLVFTDALMNVPKRGGLFGFLLGPTGRVAAPRVMRWLAIKDKRAFAAHLEKLAQLPGLKRILFGHGAPITDDAPGALRKVAAQLTA
jgi:hypothetical protein